MPPILDAVRARATLGEISDSCGTSGACTGRRRLDGTMPAGSADGGLSTPWPAYDKFDR